MMPHLQAVKPRIALFLPCLRGGGVERISLRLAEAFVDQGHPVDLVLTRLAGEYRHAVPNAVHVVELAPAGVWRSRLDALNLADVNLPSLLRPILVPLRSSPVLRYVAALAGYLERIHPELMIAAMPYPNLVAVWARQLANTQTRLIITEHDTLSRKIERVHHKWRWRFLPPVMRSVYPRADRIVAVSDGVADDLATTAELPRASITTIYNPVISSTLSRQAKAPLHHPWFAPGAPPVVLGVGRLVAQKNFGLLIGAFIGLRARRRARLLILGDGRERRALEGIVAKHGLSDEVSLPGFVDNPYQYMARAGVCVLSSIHEGLPTVLIEALACGCPIVSTDCPSGPAEILAGGVYGRLVPSDDVHALADAIEQALRMPPEPARLRTRAAEFSAIRAAEHYLDILMD